MRPNVFSALSEYGASARENYLTESCVFLLKLLLDRVPSIGLEMINQLCGLREEHQMRESGTVAISSQVSADEGRPDIEIRDAAEMLVYIDVKEGLV